MSYNGKLFFPFKGSFAASLYFNKPNDISLPPPPAQDFLLLENDAFLLLETGGKIELE